MKLFYFLLGGYLVVFLFMFFFQRTFMYHPDVNNYDSTPIEFQFEKVEIPSEKKY